VAFIDANRHELVDGKELEVEPICSVLSKAGLQVAASTYYAAKARQPSARGRRDAALRPALRRLWEDNYRVYGARKLRKAARRAGYDVGRDQVARLMRAEGIEGVRRTKRVRTTRHTEGVARHPDLVNRDFTATSPNHLWVTDQRSSPLGRSRLRVLHHRGLPRMIVGWRVASHMRTEMVFDGALVPRHAAGRAEVSQRCRQFTSVRYGERLAEIGAVPSIGTVGDSFDNALAETVNGYFKAELIRGPARPRPWRTVDDVELATLGWVHWHNASLHQTQGGS
jgi:putative transposase